ncbi:unnamed protein product [Linum trigynum]|uniref:Uncharacterized protein n=1 Tax=Linum trigynum TaxID=586398 RepID=A0AAV2E098_9ROSI
MVVRLLRSDGVRPATSDGDRPPASDGPVPGVNDANDDDGKTMKGADVPRDVLGLDRRWWGFVVGRDSRQRRKLSHGSYDGSSSSAML